MSQTLTESAAWASTVTVPDANDTGATRHVALKVTAQSLANRSQWLKGHVDNLLASSLSTTVGGSQTIAGDIVCDDITCDEIHCDLLQADTIASNGLLTGANIVSNGNVTASGTISTSANIATSNGDIELKATKRVKYTGTDSEKRRTLRCSVAGGVCSQSSGVASFNGSYWLTVNGYVISVPLPELPNGSVIESVSVRLTNSAGNVTVELVKMNIVDWGTFGGSAPTATSLATTTLTPDSIVRTATATLGTPETVLNSANDYWIRITGAGTATHNIYAALVQVRLSGPGID